MTEDQECGQKKKNVDSRCGIKGPFTWVSKLSQIPSSYPLLHMSEELTNIILRIRINV